MRYRQSSLKGPGGANGLGGCGQLGPKLVASRTPCQPAGGCGGRHRRLPMGGAAPQLRISFTPTVTDKECLADVLPYCSEQGTD